MRKKSTLAKKLASYPAFATGALFTVNSSDAQIIYTDVDPDETVEVVGSSLLDLNNDGIADFKFNLIHGVTFSGGTDPFIEQIRIVGYGSNSIMQDEVLLTGSFQSYFYANVLNSGALIGSSAAFKHQEILGSHSGGYFGNWVNISNQFLGLKLVVNSNTYYGWARLSIPQSCHQMTISDYAVDTIAGEIIVAGDKCGDYSTYANTVISASGELIFCEGGNVVMSTDSLQGGTYQWLLNGAPITGANGLAYTSDSSGDYMVIASTAYGCTDTSASVQVVIFPLPATPVITQSDDTLISTTADFYQWYMNGVAVAGATSQMFNPAQGGDYTVIITDANGCSSESETFTFIPIGIYDPGSNSATILQADNQVHIDLNDEKFSGAEIKIFNAVGENVYLGMVNNENLHIDLNHFVKGIYFLTLEKNGNSLTKKIVIQ